MLRYHSEWYYVVQCFAETAGRYGKSYFLGYERSDDHLAEAYTSVTLQCGELISTTAQDYYIVVPAGSYPDLTLTLSYKTGSNPTQTYTKTRNTSVTVQAGMITTVGANFALTTTVYKVGDLYPNADSAEGVVYAVSDGGTSGYVVDLQDASAGTTWGPTSRMTLLPGLAMPMAL